MVQTDRVTTQDVRKPGESDMSDLDIGPGKWEVRRDEQESVLPFGQLFPARADGDVGATQADLNEKPAVYYLTGLLDAKCRGLSARKALDLLEFVQGLPVPGRCAGHGTSARVPKSSGPPGRLADSWTI